MLDALRREIAVGLGYERGPLQPGRHQMDEARAGLLIFEPTLWDALPRYLRAVDCALLATTGQGLPIDATPIRFGSWIGGDRDGNPDVTSEVTATGLPASRAGWRRRSIYREVDALCARAVDERCQRRAARAALAMRANRTGPCFVRVRDRLAATRARARCGTHAG